MEVPDCAPEEWPKAAIEPFHDVKNDPVAWAKKCIHTYGAEMIVCNLPAPTPTV